MNLFNYSGGVMKITIVFFVLVVLALLVGCEKYGSIKPVPFTRMCDERVIFTNP